MSGQSQQPQQTEQALVTAAKASAIAYSEKNWDAVKAALVPNVVYDEVASQRKIQGISEVIDCWKGWARAMPDSKATFHSALVSGNTVILELTWRGTHTGPLELPGGTHAATQKTIELRSCQIVEVSNGKTASVRQYFDLATLQRQLGISS